MEKIIEYGKDIEKLNNLYDLLKRDDVKTEIEIEGSISKKNKKSIQKLAQKAMLGIKTGKYQA